MKTRAHVYVCVFVPFGCVLALKIAYTRWHCACWTYGELGVGTACLKQHSSKCRQWLHKYLHGQTEERAPRACMVVLLSRSQMSALPEAAPDTEGCGQPHAHAAAGPKLLTQRDVDSACSCSRGSQTPDTEGCGQRMLMQPRVPNSCRMLMQPRVPNSCHVDRQKVGAGTPCVTGTWRWTARGAAATAGTTLGICAD